MWIDSTHQIILSIRLSWAPLQSIAHNEKDIMCVPFRLYKHLVSECDLPKSMPNGNISLRDPKNTSYGAIADVSCNTGYEPTTPQITCTTSGTWENASCNARGMFYYFFSICFTMIWNVYYIMLGFEIALAKGLADTCTYFIFSYFKRSISCWKLTTIE